MLLDGHLLSTWQRGRRRYAIETQYRYLPWHPTVLLSTVLRRAIFVLSTSPDLDPAAVASNATQTFIAQCKTPGLDVAPGVDTYKLAMDLCATIRTILTYLSRCSLLTLDSRPDLHIPLANGISITWRFLSHRDDTGTLHRWKFVDSINDDDILSELHKWETIADMILAEQNMMVHFVSVGYTKANRRHSPWCKAYLSPTIANHIRFQRNRSENNHGKSPLQGEWKAVWLADSPKSDPESWVDRMEDDDITSSLIRHVNVTLPAPAHIKGFYRDLAYEASQIHAASKSLASPMTSLPMCRSSCDIPYRCPHQIVCYSTSITLENSGLYARRSNVGGTIAAAESGTSSNKSNKTKAVK